MPPAIVTRTVLPEDLPTIESLYDRVFGPGRFTRSAYRVREGAPEAGNRISPFCRLAEKDGAVVAAIRLTDITIGGTDGALLLGPIVVAPEVSGQGYGRVLIAEALKSARAEGRRLVILIGGMSYYGRFGFQQINPGAIRLPGPVDPARILAVELQAGALNDYHGLVKAARPPA
jgi:predicted N-acetyltransferase YhbS